MKMQSLTFQILSPTYPNLSSVIAPSIGHPTTEKIQSVLNSYNNPNHYLLGCFINQQLIGIIGVEITEQSCTINHLSVINEFQQKGIGKQCIEAIFLHFNIAHVTADTDDDAVNFYRAVKFECVAFNGPYGKRYHCTRKLAKS